jgi:hypothetical protein
LGEQPPSAQASFRHRAAKDAIWNQGSAVSVLHWQAFGVDERVDLAPS